MNVKLQNKLILSIDKFNDWFGSFGELSYDRMDYWSSKTGKLAKRLYYRNKLLGSPFALLGLLLENFFPGVQKFFAKPHREIIGDGHFASAYLNMYEYSNDVKYLEEAERFLEVIKTTSSIGYSGSCWGYTFGWETSNGYWAPGIPLITITPYAFWAFIQHYKLTNNESSKEIALSIADFALKDLKEIKMPNGTICASYSPVSEDIVINANTYRAAVLLDAYQLSGNEKYKEVAMRNIRFVLSYQGDAGEWYYEAKGSKDNFIDNFHTCFVLRNLYYCYLVTKDEDILHAVKKGYQYYLTNLFHENGRPKHFAIAKYAKLRKYEMYDYAEGITLGILLKNDIPGALDKAKWLADDLIDNFQTKKGYFITRVTSLGTKHKVPYLRWPQAQLYYALTSLLKELKN
ncbi:MAG: hypothetical protein HOO86_15670 [Bacteroidales bacterium]|nr:hypothetical protein [Bacteroidales bacterium]